MKHAAILALALAMWSPQTGSFTPAAQPPQTDSPTVHFRRGHDLLLRHDPEGAAREFALARRAGADRLVGEARYWEAFAQFRIGDPASLDEARRLLAPILLTRPADPDAGELELRILSRQAEGADPGSAVELADRAESLVAACGSGDPYAPALALAGLLRVEPLDGWRLLERTLTDASCPPSVRHNALFVVPLPTGQEGASLLARVARDDPDPSVRLDAAIALQRFSDRGGRDELLALWEAADTRAMKEQLILQYAALDHAAGEAILIRIQESDPNREVRSLARFALIARRSGVSDRFLPL
jgi:hypothetical protein